MSFIQTVRSRSPELADYLLGVAGRPLDFFGGEPLEHSANNHEHLWMIEYLADRCDWIDVGFRVRCAQFVLEQWTRRLKGLPPYRGRGYRLYVYEDMAPTVSVVAETDIGFPYIFGTPVFVDRIEEVMGLYADRSWKANFEWEGFEMSESRVLEAISKHAGSISKPSAQALGLRVGKLRSLIANMGLGPEVNAIRKRFHRRPVDFRSLPGGVEWRVYERVLPPGYE